MDSRPASRLTGRDSPSVEKSFFQFQHGCAREHGGRPGRGGAKLAGRQERNREGRHGGTVRKRAAILASRRARRPALRGSACAFK
ncbi:hypothetical protein BGLA2_1200034 [Burkholderia gladioli]|nr:hypothetical protein BGLA2_1200034 [Burkholderia gladioli]